MDPAALAKACPGAACAYGGALARKRRRRHATGHTAWAAAAAAPSSSFAFVIRESSSIKGSLSLFDGCLFTFFFLEIVAAAPRRRRLSPASVSGVAGGAALQAAGYMARLERKINFKKVYFTC